MSYITVSLLDAINNDAVNSLHTSNNLTNIMVSAGSSAINLPPIPPNTSGITINLPIFVTSAVPTYSYTNIDTVGDNSNPNTSAYPGPSTMVLTADDNTTITATNISSQECMIYALAGSIIKQLLTDNKLVNPTSAYSHPFNWYLQSATNQSVTFSSSADYPYYSFNTTTSAYSKVTANSAVYLQLEQYIPIIIDPLISGNNIIACNIIINDITTTKFENVKDYYIQSGVIYVKVKTDYTGAAIIAKTFNITMQYQYI